MPTLTMKPEISHRSGTGTEPLNGDRRTYGTDGKPIHDYDHSNPKNHPHDEKGGHHHDWIGGRRGPAHLFSGDTLIGLGLITISTVGSVYVVANDITGVGTMDDFLLGPLAVGMEKGMMLIFR